MYVPAHFAADPSLLTRLLDEAGLVDLVSSGPDGLRATPLPMLFVPGGDGPARLQGHVARNNDHWQLGDGTASVAILRGPDAYVSPSWYAAKAEHGRVVPTWDYRTVHVHGRLAVHDDVDWLDAFVRRLTDRHESGRARPWSVDDAPPRFTAGQLRGIVGVELIVDRIEAKDKLSQNRSAADVDGVIAGLAEGTARERDTGAAVAEVRG